MRGAGFFISIVGVLAVTLIICVCAFACNGGKIKFNAKYYFVCYRIADDAISASSLSGTVSSYGGAGYILNYKNSYYVTVSCYYTERDAQAVCDSLKKRDLDCSVLKTEITQFKLKGFSAQRNAQLYLGNLNTLDALSAIAYDCANGLDTGEFTQSKAKEVVSAIKSGLNGLLAANPSNCFTEKLMRLCAECDDKQKGFLYSKDMRYLQIALTDTVINTVLN